MPKLLHHDPELVLEMGLTAVVLATLGGLAVLILGRLSGDRQRDAHHAEGPPSAGSIPPERHQNLSSSPR
jgi:hypothetical protein